SATCTLIGFRRVLRQGQYLKWAISSGTSAIRGMLRVVQHIYILKYVTDEKPLIRIRVSHASLPSPSASQRSWHSSSSCNQNFAVVNSFTGSSLRACHHTHEGRAAYQVS